MHSLECRRDAKETEAGDFMMADDRDQFIVQRDKQNLCEVVFSETRLVT